MPDTLSPLPSWLPAEPPDSLPPPPDLGGLLHDRGRKVIAVGGGRGGVGKTLLTVNLGVFFAQLGRSVVVFDADPFGSNLHAMLGLDTPPLATLEDIEEHRAALAPTTVPGLSVYPATYDPLSATTLRPNRRSHWAGQIDRVEADYVLLNLGSSTAPATLDLFQHADVGICVTAPEPPAVETTYRFFRALFARALRRAVAREPFKFRLVEKTVAALPPLASPLAVLGALRRVDESLTRLASIELARLMPRLVVGQTRLRADLELGPAMCSISERFLGISPDYLGHIEHDDAVWLTVRRKRPLLFDSPTSKSARNIERVARRILALLAARDTHPPEAPVLAAAEAARNAIPLNLYDVLGITRSAADDEIRRAYKRQREVYKDGSLPVMSLIDEEQLRREQSRIEEAYDTLLDPVRRRVYDQSTFAEEAPSTTTPARTLDAAAEAELALMKAEVARAIHSDTEFSGALLRRVREAEGIEPAEIVQKLKLSKGHLAAIENESPAELPPLVYVQGFVQQLAVLYRLDPTQVSRTYMRRLKEAAARLQDAD